MKRSSRILRSAPIVLPIALLGIAWWHFSGEAEPGLPATSVQPPTDLARAINAGLIKAGTTPAETYEPGERERKIEAAISEFARHEKEADLPATPRREIAAAFGNRPPHRAPTEFMTERQRSALAKLRTRAEKQVEVRVQEEDGTVRMLAGRRLQEPAAAAEPGLSLAATTAKQFLKQNSDLLGMNDATAETKVFREEKDDLGYTQVRYRQTWEGLEVWPAEAMVQVNKTGAVDLFMGTYLPAPSGVSSVPDIDLAKAESAALDAVSKKTEVSIPGQVHGRSLVYYAPVRNEEPKLAWKVDLSAGLQMHGSIFVDAKSGAVLHETTCICANAATGSGVDLDGQTRPLNLWQEGGLYWMADTSKAMFQPGASDPPATSQVKGGIVLHDAENVTPTDQGFQIRQIASTSATAGWRPDAVHAASDVAKVYDFFRARHNRDSYDGKGGTVTVIVNVNFQNATFNHDQGVMVFGNRDSADKNTWARAFDVTAHEMGHGITGTTAGLEYEFQSGALNESYSDIFGETAEAYVYRNGVPDWLVGSRLTAPGRDMRDPNRLGQPARMSQFQTMSMEEDRGGVHVNSGIPNHAFYLLAEGLQGGGIGLDKAEHIFYRALVSGKLQRYSKLIDCRFACILAANELHGNGSVESQKTAAAFDQVELFDQQQAPAPTPLPEVSGQDSTVFAFQYWDGFTYLGRRETAFGDGANGTFLNNSPIAPMTRPAVRGDGTAVAAVMANYDGAFINTQTGSAQFFGLPGQVASVAWSADGKVYGFVFVNPQTGRRENRVALFDGQWTYHKLLSPVMDGDAADTVLFADALDLNSDGSTLVYDALNSISAPGWPFPLTSYSFYFLDRKNGSISSLAPPNPAYNVGNPGFGQRHNNLITFEAEDIATTTTYAAAIDLATGTSATLAAVDSAFGPSFPCYSGGDDAIIHADSFTQTIFRIPLGTNGVTPSSAGQAWLGGNIGVIYRRGTYQAMPMLNVAVTDGTAKEGSSDNAVMSVTRSVSTGTGAVPFSILITGTATNGTDFTKVPLNFTLPSGVNNVAVSFVPLDDTTFEGTENATLTLQDGINYRSGATVAGTISIQDNDTVPTDPYDVWLRAAFGDAVVNNAALQTSTWGPNADPDGDKIANLAEAYFGTDPKVASKITLTPARASNGDFTLRWVEGANTRGLKATPEWAPALGTWLISGQTATGIPARTITVTTPSGTPAGTKEAKLPASGLPRAMLRLRISK